MGALTLLNEMGDTTFVWGEEDDDRWKEIIEKKMKEGITFFIIEPRFKGLIPPKRTAVKNWAQAQKHRSLTIKDEDLAKLIESGAGSTVASSSKPATGARRSKDAAEVARSESIGARQRQGG